MLKKVTYVPFWDEFQEKSGNTSHIYGLIVLGKGAIDNVEFGDFVCSLQRNLVCDLFSSEEIIQGCINNGLIKNKDD